MSDIDVEAVDNVDAPSGVDAPEFVLYGGKGGVGKTTCAAATALASARDDTATLVVSTDPAHSLSDTFDAAIPAEPMRIREDVPLYAAEIDPEAAAGDGPLGMGTDLGGLGDLFGGGGGSGGAGAGGTSSAGTSNAGASSGGIGGGLGGMLGGMMGGAGSEDGATFGGDADPLAGAMPGADEAAAMQLLLEYVEDERFDRVVLDTAPTGHTLRLLELPETMDSFVGRLLKLRERLSGMLSGLGGMFGGDEDPEQVADDAAASLEDLQERIEHLRTLLRDPQRTDFRIVMVPEELSVAESTRLLAQLEEYGIPVNTIVVNRVLQDLAAVVDVEHEVTTAGGENVELSHVSPNHEDCEFCARRWDVQQRALASAQGLFQGREVKRVPLLAEEVRGERLLGVVAACLD